ncbi:MAG: membrane protein insertion efficiency factor YidD [Patescibacteria group bacterium]|nr:membrane protein insertion efficiency factor YidD [Patescibacteria group bacterium]
MINSDKTVHWIVRLPRQAVMLLIRAYQRTLSPDHGFISALFPEGYCRFYPSCSEYGHQTVEKHGIIRGFWLISGRILRCNPWNKGGIDEVEE